MTLSQMLQAKQKNIIPENIFSTGKLQIMEKFMIYQRISFHIPTYGSQPQTGFKIDNCGCMENGTVLMLINVKDLLKTRSRISIFPFVTLKIKKSFIF